MATTTSNKSRITKAMKEAGIYSPHLKVQIDALASQMTVMQKAGDIIDGLDDLTVMEKTRYGEKMAPHPVCKILRDATAEVTRMAKQLNLTVADLVGKPDVRIPMDDLMDKINNI